MQIPRPPRLIALLVCLIPTTIGGLLSAIGIAGMDRVHPASTCIAMSGKAVEACGDVDTMILDKTGTITFGNRLAADFFPVEGASRSDLIRCAGPHQSRTTTPRRASPLWSWPAALGDNSVEPAGSRLPGVHGPDPDERRGSA